MDPTVYTFGDPELVVEGLRAVATIFGGSAWWVKDEGFGLGGNMLTAALVGLLGIAIAGLSRQQIRIDALFVAFIGFAILFSQKVDVNVENWFDGQADVVSDVPLGIAWTASLASSIATSVTDATGVGLATTTRSTMTLSEGGFLDPVRVLLAVRNYNLRELNPNFHKSMMAFYRYCIGRTEEADPDVWDTYQYLNTDNALGYITDNDNVMNWTTVWYDFNTPEGVARSCHQVQALIPAYNVFMMFGWGGDWNAFAGAHTREISRDMGGGLDGTTYTSGSITQAVNILYDATQTSHGYMAHLMLANLHNEGEAWRIADYAGATEQYVQTLTAEFEQKAVQAAGEGSVFLQYMFPMMTFFQFMFFVIAPFVAFLAIASPFQAPKLFGYYLLFGLWTYSWLPIAELINHFTQLSVQDVLLNSDLGARGTSFTSIEGFSGQYAHILTHITIGSTLLAMTPAAMAAVIGGSVFAGRQVLAKIGAGSSGKNASVSTPALGGSDALFSRQPVAVQTTGQSVDVRRGKFALASKGQTAAYGNIQVGRTIGRAISAAKTSSRGARVQANTASSNISSTMRRIGSRGSVSAAQRSAVRTAQQTAISSMLDDYSKSSQSMGLSGSERKAVSSAARAHLFGSGTGTGVSSTTGFSSAQKSAYEYLQSNRSTASYRAAKSLVESGELDQAASTALEREADSIASAIQTAEKAEASAASLGQTAAKISSLGLSFGGTTTDIVSQMYAHNANALQSVMAKAHAAGIGEHVQEQAAKLFEQSAPVGLDGKRDARQDGIDRLASSLVALDSLSSSLPEAAEVLTDVLRNDAKLAIPESAESDLSTGASDSALASEAVGSLGDNTENSAEARSAKARSRIQTQSRRVRRAAQAVDATSRERADQESVRQKWADEAQVVSSTYRAQAQASAKRARRATLQGREELTKGVAGAIQNALAGEAGFTAPHLESLKALPQGYSKAAESEARSLVENLATSLTAQHDFTSDPMAVYKDALQREFEPRVAAAAAFGTVGAHRPDKRDQVVAGVFGASLSYGSGRAVERKINATANEVTRELEKEAAEKAGKTIAGRNLAGSIAKTIKFGGPAVAVVTTGYAIYMVARDTEAAAVEAEAQINATLLESLYELKGPEYFNDFRTWQETNGKSTLSSQELVNQIFEFSGYAVTPYQSDFSFQGEIMTALEAEYGTTRYEQFQSYLSDQPLPKTSTELINHAAMFYEGTTYGVQNEVDVGRAAPNDPNWADQVEALRETITKE